MTKFIKVAFLFSMFFIINVSAKPGGCLTASPGSNWKLKTCTENIQRCYSFASSERASVLSYSIPGGCGNGGWYVFKNSGNRDRDNELRSYVGPFKEVKATGTFTNLCLSIGKHCHMVIDWEGNYKSCDENPNDGSRVAYCNTGRKQLLGRND